MTPQAGTNDLPIAVIGGGVTGVMTARALTLRGRRVILIDRCQGPAQMCSHANAGILAVGHAQAWAGPAAIKTMMRAALGREPSVRLTRPFDPALWSWGIEFLRNCTAPAHHVNSDRMRRLSLYSRNLLAGAQKAMDLPPDTRDDGGLYLFRNASQFKAHVAAHAESPGGEMEVVDRDALLSLEPGLHGIDDLVGGIHSHVDSVGDCRLFTERTCAHLEGMNSVEIRFDCAVTGFRYTQGRIDAVETNGGPVECAGVVLATGVETGELCRPLGFYPQIYPVKGYSGTWRITDPAGVPKLPFVDETELLAVANYGDRLRVTAIAEFAGRDRTVRADRTAVLAAYTALCPAQGGHRASLRQ